MSLRGSGKLKGFGSKLGGFLFKGSQSIGNPLVATIGKVLFKKQAMKMEGGGAGSGGGETAGATGGGSEEGQTSEEESSSSSTQKVSMLDKYRIKKLWEKYKWPIIGVGAGLVGLVIWLIARAKKKNRRGGRV